MTGLPVFIDNLIDRELKLNITTQIMDIVNNMFQFKPKYGSFFWHDDIQLGNFILQPDFKVRLIDPDSFMHVNFDDASHTDFEFGKISNTFHEENILCNFVKLKIHLEHCKFTFKHLKHLKIQLKLPKIHLKHPKIHLKHHKN